MTWKFFSLKKHELMALRVRAFRRRVWFKTLSRIERGLVDCVIKVVDRVRSTLLTRVLRSIVKKLLIAMESKVKRLMKEVGTTLANKISLIAKSWGNRSAQEWVEDEGFIQYLTVITINTSGGLRV